MFITFEGCEGSGKSTQARLLSAHLESIGKNVLLTREPGGTEFAEKIRALILQGDGIPDPMTEFLLITAARRDHINNLITPALKEGRIVICDRFFDSSLAYQGAAKGLDIGVMKELHKIACEGFLPDLTFILDVDYETASSRIKARRGEAANHYDAMDKHFFTKLRTQFLLEASQNQKRYRVIDGARGEGEIAEELLKVIG